MSSCLDSIEGLHEMVPGWEQLRSAALGIAGARAVAFAPWNARLKRFEQPRLSSPVPCKWPTLDSFNAETAWIDAATETSDAAGYLTVPLLALDHRFGQLMIRFDRAPSPAQADSLAALEMQCLQVAADECCRQSQLELEQQLRALDEQRNRLAARKDMLDATELVGRTGSFRWRPADGQQWWSRMNCLLHGYEAGVTNPTFDMCARRLHPEDRDRFMAAVNDGLHASREINIEYRLLMPDGKVRYVLARAKPYIAGEWIGSVIDVTELRAAEDALRTTRLALSRVLSVTTMGELAAAIAHELNQPLTSMIANGGAALRWLKREPPNRQRVASSLDSIVRDARRAGDIIRALHALTLQSAPMFSPVSMDEVILDIVALTRPELSRQGIQLELSMQSHAPLVSGDRGQLRQVLLNLVSNAADAMAANDDRPKIITVSTRRLDEINLEIAVADTGTGLDTESADKLFEAFYSTKSSGMGMGLAICRSIMRQHRGTLTGRNREPHGSVFAATLPLIV